MAEVSGSASSHDGDSPVRAVLLVVFSVTIFSFQDVIFRWLSGDYPVFEIALIRSSVCVPLLVGYLAVRGRLSQLKVTRLGLVAVRAVLLFLSYTAYYLALVSIPMGSAVAIYFVSPLILTALAVMFLGEHVGLRRWCAVLIGFAGMALIMRPGSETFEPAALIALGGALVYAVFNMMTRKLAKTENAWVLATTSMIGYFVCSAIVGLLVGDGAHADESHPALGFMLRAWIVPSAGDLALMALCGVIAAVGFLAVSEGYRTAPSSVVAPFEYLYIPYAIFWGMVFWGEMPALLSWAGVALILGSGFYVMWRENVRKQKIVTRWSLRPRSGA